MHILLLNMFSDTHTFRKSCQSCQKLGVVTQRNDMLLTPTLTIEVFDCWVPHFMGLFLVSNGYLYILVIVDYVSKWADVRTSTPMIIKPSRLLKNHKLLQLRVPKAIIGEEGSRLESLKLSLVIWASCFCNKAFEILMK